MGKFITHDGAGLRNDGEELFKSSLDGTACLSFSLGKQGRGKWDDTDEISIFGVPLDLARTVHDAIDNYWKELKDEPVAADDS